MQQRDIQHYLERFFKANQCEIISSEDGLVKTKLTVELDKLLMNRPFYWHYIENTGNIGEPMTLTFLTKKNDNQKGEFIHVGSPRLHQIFETAKKTASYIRLYENITGSHAGYVPLNPWLNLNVKISYLCDQKKDFLHSIGLELITGQMITEFYKKLIDIDLTPKLPDYTFPITPLIKPLSGLNRIKQQIKLNINQDDHVWADKAKARWEKDLALLEHFYEEKEKTDAYNNEKEALRKQYEPKINVEVINGGIFYLNKARNFLAETQKATP